MRANGRCHLALLKVLSCRASQEATGKWLGLDKWCANCRTETLETKRLTRCWTKVTKNTLIEN